MNISVAIDGPAGAGKSTIAKILGKKLDLMYINTGAMYRAVTVKALEAGIEPEDTEGLTNLVASLDMKFIGDDLYVNDEDINDKLTMPLTSQNVSRFASIGEVRNILANYQRELSKKYNVIMDGRDIGTVVLKDAPYKFFLTATPEERAKRRYEELCSKGIEVNYNNILQEIIDRDYADMNRAIDPLVKAEDAIEIDTTGMSIEEVVETMYNYVRNEK